MKNPIVFIKTYLYSVIGNEQANFKYVDRPVKGLSDSYIYPLVNITQDIGTKETNISSGLVDLVFVQKSNITEGQTLELETACDTVLGLFNVSNSSSDSDFNMFSFRFVSSNEDENALGNEREFVRLLTFEFKIELK